MIDSITLKDIPKRVMVGVVLACLAVAFLVNMYGWHIGTFTADVRQNLVIMGIAIACTVLVVVLHEGLHGLFFRLFGGDVRFGVKWRTMYGPVFWASSSKLFPRLQSQAVALGPQILTIGLLVVVFAGNLGVVTGWLCLLLAGMNLCGGAFDMYVATWLRKFGRECLVKDARDGVQVFAPGYQT